MKSEILSKINELWTENVQLTSGLCCTDASPRDSSEFCGMTRFLQKPEA